MLELPPSRSMGWKERQENIPLIVHQDWMEWQLSGFLRLNLHPLNHHLCLHKKMIQLIAAKMSSAYKKTSLLASHQKKNKPHHIILTMHLKYIKSTQPSCWSPSRISEVHLGTVFGFAKLKLQIRKWKMVVVKQFEAGMKIYLCKTLTHSMFRNIWILHIQLFHQFKWFSIAFCEDSLRLVGHESSLLHAAWCVVSLHQRLLVRQ